MDLLNNLFRLQKKVRQREIGAVIFLIFCQKTTNILQTRCDTTNQGVCVWIPNKGFAFFKYLTMRGETAEMENKAVGLAQQNISKGIVEEI